MRHRPTIAVDQHAKLPKWAQEHLNALNQYTNATEYERDRVVEQVQPTRILVDWEVLGEKQCYIPTDSRVMFMFNEPDVQGHLRNYIEVYFDRQTPGLLNLHASGLLTIECKYGNGVSLRTER